MDEIPDEVWINLKILASLPTNTRLNTSNKLFYHEQDGAWTTVRRSLTGASRTSTVDSIDALIMACKRAFEEHGNDIPKLAKHLEEARTGIYSLRKTYSGDATTQAALDRIIDKMDECVSQPGS